MSEIELILYWTLLCISIGLTATGVGSLVLSRKRRGFSEKKIIKETKEKEPETPSLLGALQTLVPEDLQLSEEEKAAALPPPPDPVCEECGSESRELKPLVLAVAGTDTTTKNVCPNCLKRLTMRHAPCHG